MMIIVKIGGGAAINLSAIVAGLAKLDTPAVVVHGANALRDELATRLGQAKRIITSASGIDSVFSDAAAIDVMLMAYAGLRNKRLVELCQQQGVNAVGLTGLDGRLIQGKRNTGIRTRENGKTMLLRDFSGKPQTVNITLLRLLLDHGYTPVLTVPIADETGCAINSENDDVVAVLARDLQAEVVVQLIEAPGLLEDAADPASLITRLERADLAAREQRLSGRIKRKIMALRQLSDHCSARIVIADGRGPDPLAAALAGAGTTIV